MVELNRPGKALDLIAEVSMAKLPEPQALLVRKIAATARQMQNEGVIELDVERW